ncbi:MAG: RluA family pseudouridine synthase [Alphaproteobacteria bacterium]
MENRASHREASGGTGPVSGVRHITVGADEAALRLDRWFSRHFPDLTHGRLQRLLRAGQVRVDGARAKAGQRLAAGQVVRVPPLAEATHPRSTAQPARPRVSSAEADALRARILHKDDEIIAIDKPAGLAVQGGTGTGQHLDAMLDALRFEAPERPRLVHRLDRDTSGVLVLARSARAAAALATSFRSRAAQKVYWALVIGVPRPRQGEIDRPLAKRFQSKGERVVEESEDGKAAVTRYAVVEAMGKRAAWVALMPLTGRTHQLRAHMAAIGTPILGDGKYGGRAAFLPELPQARRLHLHARLLILPRAGEPPLRLAAPLPPHMAATWRYFGLEAEDDRDPFALRMGGRG